VTRCSVTTAEVRPARALRTRKDDFVQAGLLARGSSPFSAFPDFAPQSPVAFQRNGSPPTVAGAAPELPCRRNDSAHRIPSWLTNAISTPKLHKLKDRTLCESIHSRRVYPLARISLKVVAI
jgi:hypothetical protein